MLEDFSEEEQLVITETAKRIKEYREQYGPINRESERAEPAFADMFFRLLAVCVEMDEPIENICAAIVKTKPNPLVYYAMITEIRKEAGIN